ncbi:MAG: ABC transporter permease [Candidatus Hadarchaeota archaeon]
MDREEILLHLTDNFVWVLLIGLLIGFSIMNPAYFTLPNLRSTFKDAGVLGFLALGLGLCVIAGDFDVSLAQLAGVSAVLVGWLSESTTLPWVLIIVTPIFLGTAFGAIYGVLIGKGKFNPFLITIGGFIILQGLSRFVAAGSYVRVEDPNLLFLGKATFLEVIFYSTLLFIGIILLGWVFTKYTRSGRAIYAVGNSTDTSERIGINTAKTKILVHVLAGALAGIAGLIYVGVVGGEVRANVADGEIFKAFAAVAIGGLSIFGGRGNIIHILGGTTFIAMIIVGLPMVGITGVNTDIVLGALILIAVLLNERIGKIRDKILSAKL